MSDNQRQKRSTQVKISTNSSQQLLMNENSLSESDWMKLYYFDMEYLSSWQYDHRIYKLSPPMNPIQ